MSIVDEVLKGNRLAAARLLTMVENRAPEAAAALRALHRHTGRAHIIGITGPAGAGKSTLVGGLVATLRSRGRTVGVVAVDPSSPFTGGALLGDRIRMGRLSGDPGVYIRSMANRGAMGGLSAATAGAVDVLDAMGFDVVVVETVGAGQSDVEVARLAQTTVVVLMPGMGDDIQMIKAGILEVGDVYVVNKADKEGADTALAELGTLVGMAPQRPGGAPAIVRTVATSGEGLDDLATAVDAHREALRKTGGLHAHEKSRSRSLLIELLKQEFLALACRSVLQWSVRFDAQFAIFTITLQVFDSPWYNSGKRRS